MELVALGRECALNDEKEIFQCQLDFRRGFSAEVRDENSKVIDFKGFEQHYIIVGVH